jgi:hypothetical protein
MKRIAILMVGAALALSAPATVMAAGDGSTCEAYNPQSCQAVNSTTATRTTGTTGAVQAGTLPFTGLDVTWLLAGGVVLVGTGLAVRRVSRTLR